MKAYSLDLRQKIIETYRAGGISQRVLAKRFRVSTFFVVKLIRIDRNGERLCAKQRGGNRKPLLTPDMRVFVRNQLALQNDLMLGELCEQVKGQFGVVVSTSTMCRALKQMDLRRKKRVWLQVKGVSEEVRALRVCWQREKQPQLSKRRVWFLDETGAADFDEPKIRAGVGRNAGAWKHDKEQRRECNGFGSDEK